MKTPRALALAAGIFAVTAIAYAPSARHDFARGWDDDIQIYANPLLDPVMPDRLAKIWGASYQHLYIPLTYTAYAGLAQAALTTPEAAPGLAIPLRAGVFHAASTLAHALAAALAFALLLRLGLSPWAAVAAALFWALHPVQVEPVAWASELESVLGALFGFAALALHARPVTDDPADRPRARLAAVGAAAAFGLALLSKPTSAALPIVALAFDRWVLGRSLRFSLVRLAPWMAGAAALVLATRGLQPALLPEVVQPAWVRPVVASHGLGFYLLQLAIPAYLGPDYGWSPAAVMARGPVAYATLLVPLAMAAAAFGLRKRQPQVAAAAVVFAGALLPVSGLVAFNFQSFSTVADRYLYVALLGPAFLLGGWLTRLAPKIAVAVAAAVLLALTVRTEVQLAHWRDGESLFRHALDVHDGSFMAHTNLGNLLMARGEEKEALDHYTRATEIRPYDARALANAGSLITRLGDSTKGRQMLERAAELDPSIPEIHYKLGVQAAHAGRTNEAIGAFAKALAIRPQYFDARLRIAEQLVQAQKLDEAGKQYEAALKIDPGRPDVWVKFGSVFARMKKYDLAARAFARAVAVDPEYADGHYNLGMLLWMSGKRGDAVTYLKKAAELSPKVAEVMDRTGLRAQLATAQNVEPVPMSTDPDGGVPDAGAKP